MKKIDEIFEEKHLIRIDSNHPILGWFLEDDEENLTDNLDAAFISQKEDELYFIFKYDGHAISDIKRDSDDFDNRVITFVNFGNYLNTDRLRYNIFQIFLIGEEQELDDKVCKKLKESTNATRKIFLRSKGLSVNDEDLFLLPFWFDNQHESGVFNKESMPELEGVPEFLTKKYEDKHEFSDDEIEKVRGWLEV